MVMRYKTERRFFKILTVEPQRYTKVKGIPYLDCITDKKERIRFWGSKYNMIHINSIKSQRVPFLLECDCFIDPPPGPVDYWVHETEHQISLKDQNELDSLQVNFPLEKIKDISEGEKKISYDLLFKPYFIGAKSIKIIDPWIRLPHQIRNFVDFCQLIVSLVGTGENIQLSLLTSSENNLQQQNNTETFNNLKNNLKEDGIIFTYKFDKSIHARRIEADNGWRIDLDRGLDIFQKPEDTKIILPQHKRPCRATTIIYKRVHA